MKLKNFDTETNESVYLETEANANLFNLKALSLLILLSIISEFLNDVGIFTVPRIIMVIVILFALLFFSLPIVLFIIHDKLSKKEPSLLKSFKFKHLIIVSAFIGISLLSVILSYHVVLLMIVPPLFAAQYSYSKKTSVLVLILSVILVPVITYGSLFFGIADKNLIKNEEYIDMANRMNIPFSRLVDIFVHHILPRMFAVISVNFLTLGIIVRNKKMLDRTQELSKKVRDEMAETNRMQNKIIEDLASVIETRDGDTGEHVIRTKYYVGIIARELQKHDKYKNILTDEVITEIENAAPLHDVGKISISDTILLKPAKLSKEEFETMKTHTVTGGKMVKTIFSNLNDEKFLKEAYEIAMYHHEKWNGNGYPSGLKGEEIPLAARIMAIADVYDALVSKRVYKEPISHEEAFKIIIDEAGSHFDPEIVQAVTAIKDKFLFKTRKTAQTA